ncbi:MAG TPA: T9SS type A sorting domain-containing protein, partial [Ignavibacteriaceae bacterium]|nr:T9SS type A sorting domain-containing protein [Ignavibacteriaceae bacterium]
PFNPSTIIHYQLPFRSFVRLDVYDLLGREITTLVNEEQNTGEYSVHFNSQGLPSGIYFYRLAAGSQTITKKMVIVH